MVLQSRPKNWNFFNFCVIFEKFMTFVGPQVESLYLTSTQKHRKNLKKTLIQYLEVYLVALNASAHSNHPWLRVQYLNMSNAPQNLTQNLKFLQFLDYFWEIHHFVRSRTRRFTLYFTLETPPYLNMTRIEYLGIYLIVLCGSTQCNHP